MFSLICHVGGGRYTDGKGRDGANGALAIQAGAGLVWSEGAWRWTLRAAAGDLDLLRSSWMARVWERRHFSPGQVRRCGAVTALIAGGSVNFGVPVRLEGRHEI